MHISFFTTFLNKSINRHMNKYITQKNHKITSSVFKKLENNNKQINTRFQEDKYIFQ